MGLERLCPVCSLQALGGMMGMPQAHAAQAQAQMQRPMGSKPGAGSSSEAKAWKLFVGQVGHVEHARARQGKARQLCSISPACPPTMAPHRTAPRQAQPTPGHATRGPLHREGGDP